MTSLSLPAPRTPAPSDAPAIRWGVLGPGNIARSFARAVVGHTASTIAAVGSRSLERARAFADEFGAAHAHGSYEDLVADDTVDAVYIATPHSEHHDHALLALAAGRPVLVEKSFARSAAEAREVLGTARDRGLLAVEAMWTRFLPQTDVLRQVLAAGTLGEIMVVTADHGQLFEVGPEHRMLDPEQAGGALLDLGVYPVSFAHLVTGPLTELHVIGDLTTTGVDARETVSGRGTGDEHVLLHATQTARTPTRAAICGTAARIELDGPFYGLTTMRLIGPDGIADTGTHPGADDDGYAYEAAEFARRLTEGATETPLMTARDTVEVMEILDAIRRELGVVYPGEDA